MHNPGSGYYGGGGRIRTYVPLLQKQGAVSYLDIITINYTNEEVFISRACGYKNIYKNLGFDFTTDGDNWIFNYSVENNIVENENSAHIHIYH